MQDFFTLDSAVFKKNNQWAQNRRLCEPQAKQSKSFSEQRGVLDCFACGSQRRSFQIWRECIKNCRIEFTKKGFTLIEILIVILIIGIISTAALYAFGDFGGNRKAIVSAEQFKAYIDLLQQRALVESNTLGVFVTSTGYEAYRLKDGKTWSPMPKTSIFRPQTFPQHLRLVFKSNLKNNANQPTLTISPTGELTPIDITFGTEQSPHLVQFSTHQDKTEIVYE